MLVPEDDSRLEEGWSRGIRSVFTSILTWTRTYSDLLRRSAYWTSCSIWLYHLAVSQEPQAGVRRSAVATVPQPQAWPPTGSDSSCFRLNPLLMMQVAED